MNGLLAALGFLTRIPVPLRVFDDADAKSRSLAWYPLVGLLIGAILAVLAGCLPDRSPLLSGSILLVVWVMLTGAMHLDGLADSADAWIGGMGDRDRTLEIMKDPRCGPAGVVSIVLVLLLKGAALASLPPAQWIGLLLAPLLARAVLTAAFLSTRYVRAGGLGSELVDAPRGPCRLALGLTAVVCLGAAGWHGLWALLAAAVVFGVWRRVCVRRLGGMTGDTCGALTELAEVVVLVVWVLTA